MSKPKIETPANVATARIDPAWLDRIEREHGRAARDEAERRWREQLRLRQN